MASIVHKFGNGRAVVWGPLEAIAAVGLCTLLCLATLSPEHEASVACLYLAAIMISTLRRGLWPGVLASALSYLAMDYFFLPPLHRIDFDDPIDWLSLLVFLGTVGLINHLLQGARVEAAAARRREHVARLIAGVSQATGMADGLAAVLQAVVDWASQNLPIRGCAVLLPSPTGVLAAEAQAGTLPELSDEQQATAARAFARAAVETCDAAWRTVFLPLVVGDRAVGSLGLLGAATTSSLLDDEHLRVTLSHQLGVAIERARFKAESTEAEILRRSDELKSTLLSLVGHELRTPLTIIKTAAASLHADALAHDDNASWTLTHVIDQETDRLHHLVSNILDLSRIDGGALRLTLDWYDLGEFVREAVDRLRPVLASQVVEVTALEEMPPVQIDYLLFDRVVANLLLNALRFTPSEAPIRITVERRGDQAVLTVSDHGPGVPSHELPRIFDRFYRGVGAGAGVGLGLALCRGIVEAHGGHIWAESPVAAGGLAISVALPSARGPLAPLPADDVGLTHVSKGA